MLHEHMPCKSLGQRVRDGSRDGVVVSALQQHVQGGNNLSATRVDPMLGLVWIFQLCPLDRVNQWLTFKVILTL